MRGETHASRGRCVLRFAFSEWRAMYYKYYDFVAPFVYVPLIVGLARGSNSQTYALAQLGVSSY